MREVFVIALVQGNNVRYLDSSKDWVPDPQYARLFHSMNEARRKLQQTEFDGSSFYRIDSLFTKP